MLGGHQEEFNIEFGRTQGFFALMTKAEVPFCHFGGDPYVLKDCAISSMKKVNHKKKAEKAEGKEVFSPLVFTHPTGHN